MTGFMRSLEGKHGIEFPERRVPLGLAEITLHEFDFRCKRTKLLARQVMHRHREIERNVL
jgi:hypothetical protein